MGRGHITESRGGGKVGSARLQLRWIVFACFVLAIGLAACEDATSPRSGEVYEITSSSPSFSNQRKPHEAVGEVSGTGTVAVGDSIRLTALDSDGAEVVARWSSSAPEVASVSSTGLVRAHSVGAALVTARTKNRRAVALIEVVPGKSGEPAPSQPPSSPSPDGALPVFPGAEGAGTATPAGRGGKVIRVTNLNDSGPGSLREALNARGPRVVIFDVAGTITLSSNLSIREPYLTLAGQTAPSPGITIRGGTIVVQTHDVLIQHIRVRVGDDPSGPNPGSRDGLRVLGSSVYNVVIDHVSASWSIDEVISTYDHKDVTIRNSIFSEGLSRSIHPEGEHSKGVFIAEGSHNLTLVGSLIAHNRDRNPAIKGNTSAVIVNNVIYNWGNGAAIPIWDSNSDPTYKPTLASIVGNVFISGANTPSSAVCVKVYESVAQGTRIHLADNLWAKGGADPWSIAESKAGSGVKASSPPVWTSLTVRPSEEVERWVLATAGARPADRDAVDARIIEEVRTRTGRIIDSPSQVGGWPSVAQRTRVLSLPDNPNAIDPTTGYTNLELWLHRLAAEVEGRTYWGRLWEFVIACGGAALDPVVPPGRSVACPWNPGRSCRRLGAAT